MKPWQVNLTALALLVVVAFGVRVTSGQGPLLEVVLGIFGLIWGAQVAVLWWSARRQRPPPTFTSIHLVALWAAALYPLVLTATPTLHFPNWFVMASVPVGYLIWYGVFSAFLWFTGWQFRVLSRIRGNKT